MVESSRTESFPLNGPCGETVFSTPDLIVSKHVAGPLEFHQNHEQLYVF